jgi:uncharacterized protein YjiS (DUF1127 family)
MGARQMMQLSIGGSRRLSFFERTRIATRDAWLRWRAARLRAQVARQLRDYDEHLLRDIGLTRGDYDKIVPLR